MAGRSKGTHRAVAILLKQAATMVARRQRKDAARLRLVDVDESTMQIVKAVRPYTVTPSERVVAICASVDYIVAHEIPGAFVECGLWRGGSLMATLLRLLQLGVADRQVVGFDTFAGMTPPTALDVDYQGRIASSRPPALKALSRVTASIFGWELPIQAGVSRNEVFALLTSTGYPPDRIELAEGPVEATLPAQAPDAVALLRLDTDWYGSTRHELDHLYPRLAVGGVLLIDDYGHYRGAKKAVDEYFLGHRILLQRIDYAARLAVKQQHS